VTPPEPASADARCARHPGALAAATCSRCGSFACTECLGGSTAPPLCEACRNIAPPEPKAPGLALAIAAYAVPMVVGWIAAEITRRARLDKSVVALLTPPCQLFLVRRYYPRWGVWIAGSWGGLFVAEALRASTLLPEVFSLSIYLSWFVRFGCIGLAQALLLRRAGSLTTPRLFLWALSLTLAPVASGVLLALTRAFGLSSFPGRDLLWMVPMVVAMAVTTRALLARAPQPSTRLSA
jgi:hypothetical protein